MDNGQTNLMTKKDLAKWLSVSERTISKLTNEKGLPHIRIGQILRYDPYEVKKWLYDKSKYLVDM